MKRAVAAVCTMLLMGTVSALDGSAGAAPASTVASAGSLRTAADPYPRTVRTKCVAKLAVRTQRIRHHIKIRFDIQENIPDDEVHSWIGVRRLRNREQYEQPEVARRHYQGDPRTYIFNRPPGPGQYRFMLTSHTGEKDQFRYCRVVLSFKVHRHNPHPHRG